MVQKRPQPQPAAGRSAGMAEYLKRAFLYRWNMLLFLGGVGAAILSPWPDALLPIVAATEIAYLGSIVSMPRFRAAIDASLHQEAKQESAATASQGVQEIVGRLSFDSRKRFEQLRARCLEMRVIANEVRGKTGAAGAADDLSAPALDRLLWVFLRLLVSQEALDRFLERTNVEEIRTRLSEAKAKIESYTGSDERIARSLQDSVAAHQQRLENYERARGNSEFVRIELDRIEAKINAITESSVNRQNPDLLSSQIDSVAESMQSTERAISELQQITGIVDEMQEPPAILEADLRKVQQ
jgi:phage terminase Nu1 subunit (DNA packaging protein)